MLNKLGKWHAAMIHFGWALRVDPSMVAAKRWIDYCNLPRRLSSAHRSRSLTLRIIAAAPANQGPQPPPPSQAVLQQPSIAELRVQVWLIFGGGWHVP